jgi:hypothetical protein
VQISKYCFQTALDFSPLSYGRWCNSVGRHIDKYFHHSDVFRTQHNADHIPLKNNSQPSISSVVEERPNFWLEKWLIYHKMLLHAQNFRSRNNKWPINESQCWNIHRNILIWCSVAIPPPQTLRCLWKSFISYHLNPFQRIIMILDPLKWLPRPDIFSNVSWRGREGETCVKSEEEYLKAATLSSAGSSGGSVLRPRLSHAC